MKRCSIILLLACVAPGCASNHPTTRPSDARERQEAALRDPFGYSPGIEKQDISGGKVNQYDRDAMRKDVDHVLNP